VPAARLTLLSAAAAPHSLSSTAAAAAPRSLSTAAAAAPRSLSTAAAAAPRSLSTAAAAALAGVAALLCRLPFAAHRLWDHDSIQFALGVEKYDLAAHHPHPPGYPLYIGLLKLLAGLGIDSLHGMVGLAVLSGALGAAFTVLLTIRLVSRVPPGRALRAGLFAGLLYAFNPLLWFYAELPLLYAVEGGLTVALAYSALRMGDGARPFLAACALFALAGGLRPSTMVLLAPLFLLGLWRARRRGSLGLPLVLGGAALSGTLVLAWLVPLCAAAGGLAAYRRIGSEHFNALLPYTSILYGAGWGALAHNLEVLAKWTLQGIFPGAAALLSLWLVTPRRIAAGLRLLAPELSWLLAWAAPPVLFFALVHVTKAGYTLVYLPAFLVAIAVAATPALAASRWRHLFALVLSSLLGGGLFLFGADRRPEQPRSLAVVRNEFNRGAIAAYEADLDKLLAVLRRYPPQTTVLATVELSGTGAAAAEGFLYPWQRHLQWYLPQYPVVLLVPEQRFALLSQGHRPFYRQDTVVELPPLTRQILFVLSAPAGPRLDLGPAPAQRVGKTFYLLAVPFAGELRVGPLLLETAGSPQQRRGAGATPGQAGEPLSEEALAAIIYAETGSLRPRWKNPKGAKREENYDPNSVRRLHDNRKAIGHVVEQIHASCRRVGDGTVTARPLRPSERDLANPNVAREWKDAKKAAEEVKQERARRLDPLKSSENFFIRADGRTHRGVPRKQPRWARGRRPAITWGPFRNLGGGDVRVSADVYIDVYNLR
jgi:hypothetical protein